MRKCSGRSSAEDLRRRRRYISATGSAGTIAAGDYLKKQHPALKIVATEALQCPTLLMNGFGDHRIEGIGDKHIPWVHNVRNTDAVAAIDDEDCMRILRLFNEPAGQKHLASLGVKANELKSLPLLGISSICNLLAAIKTAKYFELNEHDVIFTVFTDSTELYGSRVEELKHERGAYRAAGRHRRLRRPAGASERGLLQGTDLSGTQGDSQPEVLHLGRAAGENFGRADGTMESGILAGLV